MDPLRVLFYWIIGLAIIRVSVSVALNWYYSDRQMAREDNPDKPRKEFPRWLVMALLLEGFIVGVGVGIVTIRIF